MSEVVRLPGPERLEPKQTKRSLMISVRVYFYSLYNGTNSKFRELLWSVGNKDSVHNANRMFDRHEAVGMIRERAKEAKDTVTISAKDGHIYHCLVNLMRAEGLGIKLRRSQYRELTQQRSIAAE